MGTLTTTELIDEVSTHLASRSDVTDSRIVRALNMAQEYLARTKDYEELRAVITGTFTITASPGSDKFLPFSSLSITNPHEIYSFRVITADGRSRKLHYRTTRTFDRLIPEPEFYARGIPDVYIVWNDKFELWRVPDEAYDFEIRITKFATALSVGAGGAKSDFREKDDLLVFLGVSWLFGQLGEYDRMGLFFSMFNTRAKQAELKEARRPDQDIISDAGGADSIVTIGEPWANPFIRFMR